MTGFDVSPEPDDNGLFFAGIGADDEDPEAEEEEEATLADTLVRPDDDATGSAPLPLLGMGAGTGGAAALGAYAGHTRADHERSRSGVAGVPVVPPTEAIPDEARGMGVDAYGRVTDEDHWGIGGADDAPPAFLSGAATTDAPRTRGSGGTRGSYLSRNEGTGGAGAPAPGATLGGIGGAPSGQGAAVAPAAGSGSQQGGIPLSVLQNLQNNKTSGAAFAPMTGVQASGSHGYLPDPSLLAVQAFGPTAPDGVDGDSSQEWLRTQLREHEYRGTLAPEGPGADGPEVPEDAEPDGEVPDGDSGTGGRRNGRDATALAGAGAVGGWGGGSATSGSAPMTGSGSGGSQPTGRQNPPEWGWNNSTSHVPGGGVTGAHATGARDVDGTTFTPGGNGNRHPETDSAPAGSGSGISGTSPTGLGDEPRDRDHYGLGSGWGRTADAVAQGSDFNVSSDELSRDAEHWRRMAVEMEGVGAVTGTVRDGESSFGLVSEPAAAYSRATHQSRLWAGQASKAYEEIANQLHATAAGYSANEQAAVDGTGRAFES